MLETPDLMLLLAYLLAADKAAMYAMLSEARRTRLRAMLELYRRYADVSEGML